MKLNLDRYNTRIREATQEVVNTIKAEGESMNIQHRGADVFNGDRTLRASNSKSASLPKVKPGFKESDGAIDQAAIKFNRNLIWTHRGAGRGRGGKKGSSWVDKYGATQRTNPSSFGKMGTKGRTAKPFINNVLDSEKGVDLIATVAAEELGDALVGSMLIN